MDEGMCLGEKEMMITCCGGDIMTERKRSLSLTLYVLASLCRRSSCHVCFAMRVWKVFGRTHFWRLSYL
jgi:hypothetical protein